MNHFYDFFHQQKENSENYMVYLEIHVQVY